MFRPVVTPLLLAVIGVLPLHAQQVSVPSSAAPATAANAIRSDTPGKPGGDINDLVLAATRNMPRGGGYAANGAAVVRLAASVRLLDRGSARPSLAIDPTRTAPSFCSAATYLVFLKAAEALRVRGEVALDERALDALRIAGQRDGMGVWGRWNANGPGTARLFHELHLGRNFTDFAAARPGDFLKVFWTNEIGRREHGHSVVFLGTERGVNGEEMVRFWSANLGAGYSEKSVPKTKIAYAIFSRFENPRALAQAADLPETDGYLAKLLQKDSSQAEARDLCGL